MRLERLEATQRPDKLKAVFDGETLGVSASLCVQYSLCAGMELDEEAFSEQGPHGPEPCSQKLSSLPNLKIRSFGMPISSFQMRKASSSAGVVSLPAKTDG